MGWPSLTGDEKVTLNEYARLTNVNTFLAGMPSAGVSSAERAVPSADSNVLEQPGRNNASNRFIDINIPAYELTLFQVGVPPSRYAIAIGKPGTPTPIGRFRIATKVVNPTWYPGDGEEPVAPGPDNPVGSRWIGLSLRHYGIHGTNSPSSIGRAVSKGCIRMYPSDVEELFDSVRPGDPVVIRYDTIEMERDKIAGNWFLVVYADLYRLRPPSCETVAEAARRSGAGVPAPAVLRQVLDLVLDAPPSSRGSSAANREAVALRFALVRGGLGEEVLGASAGYRSHSVFGKTAETALSPRPSRSRPCPLAVIPWPEHPRFVPAE